MPLPNFFLIGAAKSGTSAVFHALGQHPEVYVSEPKEPMFFAYDPDVKLIGGGREIRVSDRMVLDRDAYLSLFEGVRNENAVGEGSTAYLHREEAAERVATEVPEARLLAILRNPITRAYSAFDHARLEGWELESDFLRALELEPERFQNNWTSMVLYRHVGRYAAHIERWLRFFPPERFRIYVYEDFVRAPAKVLRDMFEFLGVEPSFSPDLSKRYHVARAPRHRLLHRVLRRRPPRLVSAIARAMMSEDTRARLYLRTYEMNLRVPRPLPAEAASKLRGALADDVRALSELLGRDLTPWLDLEAPEIPSGDVGAHPASLTRD